MLKNGNPHSPGGRREGAGRKPSWVRERCQKLIEDAKVLEFLANVVKGVEKDFKVTKMGGIIPVPASIHDRIDAARELLDRGFGKSMQMLGDEDGQPITFEIIQYKRENKIAA